MCQWYVEALDRKLCVVVSSLSRGAKSIILYNDFIARVIFINVNVLYTLSRKPVKYKSRGSMVFKDSCHVQDEEWRKLHVRIFTDIEIKKLRKIVSPINNNKQIQYTLHILPRSTFISCPREPPPFPPNCPSPTIESIRVRCYKKKSARHFRFYAASDVITRTHTHLSRMIFFFFICTRPIDSPFHPRMPTNRGIHGRVVGRIIRAMISRLERVCLTPLISRQGSYRCQDLGGGVRSDRGALSSLFAPHSSLV